MLTTPVDELVPIEILGYLIPPSIPPATFKTVPKLFLKLRKSWVLPVSVLITNLA